MSWPAKIKNTFFKAKKMKDKLSDMKDKVNKIHSTAEKLGHLNSLSAKEMMELAQDGMSIVASKCPMVSTYLSYHEVHFALLGNLTSAASSTADAMKILQESSELANQIDIASKSIVRKYGFVSGMLDHDGKFPDRLPAEFTNYSDLMEEYESAWDKNGERKMSSLRAQMAKENAILSAIVHERAIEVASAFLKISNDTNRFRTMLLKASNERCRISRNWIAKSKRS